MNGAKPTITLVVAVSENGIIGRDGGLPWHLSSDLKRFKADTMGRPIVMGRKTYASIGRLLPGRENIIISRDKAFSVEGATVCPDVESALQVAAVKARAMGASDIAIIGGGQIYAQSFERADRLIVTWVLAHIDGDTHFPSIDEMKWQVIESTDYPAGEKDSHATRRVVYERRR